MRRLDQHVTGIDQRKQAAGPQPSEEIRADVDVRASDQNKRNRFRIKRLLQRDNRLSNCRSGIMVQTRQNMRRAGNDLDALGRCGFRHGQRHRKVGRTVVDSGQDMAMKVDHDTRPRPS